MKLALTTMLCFTILVCNSNAEKNNGNNIEIKNSRALDCIDNVMQFDQELGKIRNHSCEQISLSETINEYTNGLKYLDYEYCPEKFKLAFKEHINAWLNIKRVTDNYPELRGEMHELFNVIENGKDSVEFKSLNKRIWDTWCAIENNIID